jgi:hypothetical protein
MKIVAFILSFYLLFLAIEPGLKAMSLSESEQSGCCSDSSCEPIEKKQPEKRGCDDNQGCNPFQSCKTCTAFTSAVVCLNFIPNIVFSKLHTEKQDKVPPQITIDFWHPPKIA